MSSFFVLPEIARGGGPLGDSRVVEGRLLGKDGMLSYKPRICHSLTMPAARPARRSASIAPATRWNRTSKGGPSVRFRAPEGLAA